MEILPHQTSVRRKEHGRGSPASMCKDEEGAPLPLPFPLPFPSFSLFPTPPVSFHPFLSSLLGLQLKLGSQGRLIHVKLREEGSGFMFTNFVSGLCFLKCVCAEIHHLLQLGRSGNYTAQVGVVIPPGSEVRVGRPSHPIPGLLVRPV